MLIKVCDKCGKIKGSNVRGLEEVCKYCGGKMIIKGEQKSMPKTWQEARQ